MSDISNIKQFKLANGEEIICEVVEWADEENVDLVVRNALNLVVVDDDHKHVRYYNLKPWMTMQEGDEVFMTLNTNHIISVGNPTSKLLKYFYEAVENSNLSEEEISKKIDDYVNKLKAKMSELGDDSDSNVIRFRPDKNKLH
jgi:hypothetical protein